MSPFVRVWPHGGVSYLCLSDPRAWPWAVAVVLRWAQQSEGGNRQALLLWAERMALHRQVHTKYGSGSWTRILYELIDTCDYCGKKATRMQAGTGLCAAHQNRVPPAEACRRQWLLKRALEIAETDHEWDRHHRKNDGLRRLHQGAGARRYDTRR